VTGRTLGFAWLLSLGWCATAHGAERVQIALVYEAPADCPSQAELAQQIAARSQRIQIGEGRHFQVTITPSWQARIAVGETVREVAGETCREVVAAAALIIAVLAEREAPSEPAPASPAPTPPPPPLPALPEPERTWPWRFALGVGLTFETAPTPDLLLSPRPFVAFEHRPGILVRPALRLSVARGSSGSITTEAGIAELTWTAGRLEACADVGDDEGLGAAGCGTFELGAIRGRGIETLDGADETELWLAPGLIVRASYGLGQLFRFELAGGPVFPMRRYRFYFGPEEVAETAHKVPSVGASFGVGIGVMLP
jgi:hypothetical protein